LLLLLLLLLCADMPSAMQRLLLTRSLYAVR